MAKVKATQMGFYKGERVREGAVFDLADDLIKRDGKGVIVRPRWVTDVSAKVPVKAVFGDTKPAATQKAVKEKTAPEHTA